MHVVALKCNFQGLAPSPLVLSSPSLRPFGSGIATGSTVDPDLDGRTRR